MDRRKKSRANREQLRCCNWIRLPIGPIPGVFGGEGGKKVRPAGAGPESQKPEYLSGPPHSCLAPRYVGGLQTRRHSAVATAAKKLLRKKKNESWAMRPRPYKSDSRSWRKLVCKIVQFGSVRSTASRPGCCFGVASDLLLSVLGESYCTESPRSRDALATPRRALPDRSLRCSPARRIALRRKRRHSFAGRSRNRASRRFCDAI